jgi:hypothetical protein
MVVMSTSVPSNRVGETRALVLAPGRRSRGADGRRPRRLNGLLLGSRCEPQSVRSSAIGVRQCTGRAAARVVSILSIDGTPGIRRCVMCTAYMWRYGVVSLAGGRVMMPGWGW